MIEVKLTFASQAELVAFFTGNTGAVSAPEKAMVADIKVGKSKPAPAATDASSPQPAAPKDVPTTEAKADPKPAAAATSDAPAASSEKPAASVDYPTLQKAVFALAGKSRESAAAVAASFGVKTFKELPESKWADALAAVNTALAA